MKHILVVVDIQKDFVDGALGTAEAVAIVENAAKKISNFNDAILESTTPICYNIGKGGG